MAHPLLSAVAMLARLLACVVTFTVAGCITHLPLRTRDHLRIAWVRDFDDAQARATRLNRPILAVLVAGEIAGPC